MTAGPSSRAVRAARDPVAASGPDPVVAATRWVMPHLLVLGVAITMVRLAAMPLSNFDTYFHLRFGHEFLDGTWSLGDPGSVSTFATADWVPTQWLPQIVMAKTEDWFGLAGVAWLSGALFLGLAFTLYAVARRVADPVVAAPIVVVALVASSSGMAMRPQLVSYILVAGFTSAWLRVRPTTARTPWLLVPLTWVWATCHGMWPVGIVIGIVAVTGISVDRRRFGRPELRLAAVPVLSALVSFATPVGPGLFGAVLLVDSRSHFFSEWASPDVTAGNTVALLLLLAITIVIAIKKGASWLEIALVGLAAAWAVYSLRTVPVAAAMVTPLVAVALQRLLGARTPLRRPERPLLIGIAVVALAALTVVAPRTADEPPSQPAWVDPALGSMPVGTKVFDGSAFGGYLMWRYPQLDLVQHGYGDTYTTDELQRNLDISDLRPGWLELLRDTEAEYAVLDPSSGLAYALRELAGWQVVEDDPEVQLLVPPPGWAVGSG